MITGGVRRSNEVDEHQMLAGSVPIGNDELTLDCWTIDFCKSAIAHRTCKSGGTSRVELCVLPRSCRLILALLV